MRRLVRLDEETTWIHRSWTLLEALAPPNALFQQALGPVPSTRRHPLIQSVVAGRSTIIRLMHLLGAAAGYHAFNPSSTPSLEMALKESSLFGTHTSGRIRNGDPFGRRQQRLRNIVALHIAVSEEKSKCRAYAVWQCAMMRALPSSRHDTQQHRCV